MSVGVLALEGAAGPLVLALDGVDDALRQLDQELRRMLGVNTIDVLALQFIDRRQRRGASTRVRDLAPRLGVSSGTATMIVRRLERAQLVESAKDPADGRGRRIVLGLRAHELAHGRLSGVRGDLSALIDSLEPEQEDELIDLLGRVRHILTRADTATIGRDGDASTRGARERERRARARAAEVGLGPASPGRACEVHLGAIGSAGACGARR